ncbi:MAG: dual OB domain-containing protein [Thermodesulfobacteriota bacterium]
MPPVRFICLANSNKMGGRCIAGLRLDGKGWIRPVGPSSSRELSSKQYRLNDYSEPKLLDVLEVDLSRPVPEPHQPENFLISKKRWRLVERPASARCLKLLESYLVSGPGLFGNPLDRVAHDIFKETAVASSLALVQPKKLRWIIDDYAGKRRSRAFFELGKIHYNLAITDPWWKARMLDLPYGMHPLTEPGLKGDERILLTLSLGDPFEGFCYKLVAAIIIMPT